MINEKQEQEGLFNDAFDRLMYQYCIICRMIRFYDKQLEECQKKLDNLKAECFGIDEEDEKDGKSV